MFEPQCGWIGKENGRIVTNAIFTDGIQIVLLFSKILDAVIS